MLKNVTVAKFELAFTRRQHNLKTIEDSTVKNSVPSLQEFDAKEMYLHLKNRLTSFQSVIKCPVLVNSEYSQNSFQNVPVRVPFSKCTVFKIGRQKLYCFHVNGRPIHHIFHLFQNVTASCERSLIVEISNLTNLPV